MILHDIRCMTMNQYWSSSQFMNHNDAQYLTNHKDTWYHIKNEQTIFARILLHYISSWPTTMWSSQCTACVKVNLLLSPSEIAQPIKSIVGNKSENTSEWKCPNWDQLAFPSNVSCDLFMFKVWMGSRCVKFGAAAPILVTGWSIWNLMAKNSFGIWKKKVCWRASG